MGKWSPVREHERAWRYVGRFMGSFGKIEAHVDAIFEIMFNLNPVAYFLLHNKLDLRKKIDLVQLGFKHQGIDHGETLERIRHLIHVRNAIAHSAFEPVAPFELVENGTKVRYEAGIEFSYIDQHGKMRIPGPFKGKRRGPEASLYQGTSIISYTEFDEHEAELWDLGEILVEISGHCEPVDEEQKIVPDIESIIADSESVVKS